MQNCKEIAQKTHKHTRNCTKEDYFACKILVFDQLKAPKKRLMAVNGSKSTKTPPQCSKKH